MDETRRHCKPLLRALCRATLILMASDPRTVAKRDTPADIQANTQRLSRLSPRLIVAVVFLGLVGQLAWTVENMYLNVFVYQTITDSPQVIAALVAASALSATVATLLLGALSDRVGTRRPFIAVGYIIWGVLTASFGFVHSESYATGAQVVSTAVIVIILLDCAMSFFGAGANDAAFSAWVTDSTDDSNRGRIDGILQIMPMVAMLVVFGALDGFTQAGNWKMFFGIVGVVTAIVGIASWFVTADAPAIERNREGYLRSLVYGMRPSTVRKHKALYVTLLAWAVIGTSTQVFLPYVIIYLQKRLQIEGYAIVLATVIILSSIATVLGGRVIDRIGKVRAILPASAVMVIGYAGMFFARQMIPVIVFATIMFTGFMLSVAAIAAAVRDATPQGHVGMVQGLRMIAMVLIPMFVGPFIGATVISGAGETYIDLGVIKQVPTPWIFPAAAAVALLVIIPVAWLTRLEPSAPQTESDDS